MESGSDVQKVALHRINERTIDTKYLIIDLRSHLISIKCIAKRFFFLFVLFFSHFYLTKIFQDKREIYKREHDSDLRTKAAIISSA